MFALVAPAHAATFNVNSTADQPDADPTNGSPCATAGGTCTLRAAIDQANADDSDSTINLPAGIYTLTGAPADNDNESGDLDVHSRGFTVNIVGAGARTTIINGGGVDRVLDIDDENSKVILRGVTITGGNTNVVDDLADEEIEPGLAFDIFIAALSGRLSDGGGIYLDGPPPADDGEVSPSQLTVIDSTITGNVAGNEIQFVDIFPDDVAEELFFFLVDDLGLSEEFAFFLLFNEFRFGDGGGIHAGEETQLSVTGSTISSNTARDDGGGIESDAANTSILNSTIHANATRGGSDGDGDGGGIEQNEGDLSVVHATITDNTAPDKGGGVNLEQEECSDNFFFCLLFGDVIFLFSETDSGRFTVTQQQEPPPPPPPGGTFRNTILAANQAPGEGPNCRADEASSLTSAGTNLESGTDCGFSAAGNLQNTDPLLGPLANNGGQTDTRALGPTSPPLHRATTAPCPPTDQRGTTRPQGPACDIGAYERVLQSDLQVAIDDSPDPVTPGQNITYTILVRNGGPDPATDVRLAVTLPSGVTLQSSSIEGGGSCSGESPLICPIGNLGIGETRLIRIVVQTSSDAASASAGAARIAQADSGGDLVATARVSATQTDPVPSNNEAVARTNVVSGEEDEAPVGEDTEGVDTAGVSGTGEDLPFTGLPLAILIAAGAWMLGAGLTLRMLASSWDEA